MITECLHSTDSDVSSILSGWPRVTEIGKCPLLSRFFVF